MKSLQLYFRTLSRLKSSKEERLYNHCSNSNNNWGDKNRHTGYICLYTCCGHRLLLELCLSEELMSNIVDFHPFLRCVCRILIYTDGVWQLWGTNLTVHKEHKMYHKLAQQFPFISVIYQRVHVCHSSPFCKTRILKQEADVRSHPVFSCWDEVEDCGCVFQHVFKTWLCFCVLKCRLQPTQCQESLAFLNCEYWAP